MSVQELSWEHDYWDRKEEDDTCLLGFDMCSN